MVGLYYPLLLRAKIGISLKLTSGVTFNHATSPSTSMVHHIPTACQLWKYINYLLTDLILYPFILIGGKVAGEMHKIQMFRSW
jgi:hypothetical protein